MESSGKAFSHEQTEQLESMLCRGDLELLERPLDKLICPLLRVRADESSELWISCSVSVVRII